MNPGSCFWFDYETFGLSPRWDRPAQFAGLRTDLDLEPIDEPVELHCQLSPDYLPWPAACRVTGLAPANVHRQGVPEAHFIERIREELARPGTCSVGYNNIRFDDEVTRHTLFRNLLDPYRHEWDRGNTRWDIVDLVRMTRALRPEGIRWPIDDSGRPSNRLEDLSTANGLEHEQAHDALSDVRATLAVARLIRTVHPRLYEFLWSHRRKSRLGELLARTRGEPLLLVSGKIPFERSQTAIVLPVMRLSSRPNTVVLADLNEAVEDLPTLDDQALGHALYPQRRLLTVALNRCPALAPLSVLRHVDAERLGIDKARCLRHADALKRQLPNAAFDARIESILTERPDEGEEDVDGSLYSGGFLGEADRRRLDAVRAAVAEGRREWRNDFDDTRLNELVFRYVARNRAELLDESEHRRWQEHCHQRLVLDDAPWATFETFLHEWRGLAWTDEEASLRAQLHDWFEQTRHFSCRVDPHQH